MMFNVLPFLFEISFYIYNRFIACFVFLYHSLLGYILYKETSS